MKNKKVIIILVCAILVVAVAIGVVAIWGKDISNALAGEELIECVMVNDYEGEAKFETKYTIHSNKKTKTVNKVDSVQTIETDNKEIISFYADKFEEAYGDAKKNYGGIDYNIDKSDKKLSFELTIDYLDVDIDKLVKDNEKNGNNGAINIKDFLNEDNKIKTDDLKANYEKQGYGCNPVEK